MSLNDIIDVDTPFAQYMTTSRSSKLPKIRNMTDLQLERESFRLQKYASSHNSWRLTFATEGYRAQMIKLKTDAMKRYMQLRKEMLMRQFDKECFKSLLQLRSCCKYFYVVFTNDKICNISIDNKLKFLKSYDSNISFDLAKTSERISDKWVSSCVDSLNRPRISYVHPSIINRMHEEICKHVKYIEIIKTNTRNT